MSESGSNSTAEILTRIGRRPAGSDAERRATNAIAADLRSRGKRSRTEPIHVHPHWPLAHFVHCILGVAGSLLATVAPALAFGLVLFAATSTYLDFSGRLLLVRRLTFRRASQNLISPPRAPEDRPRVLLCANLDSPRTGAAFNPGPTRLLDRAWSATRGLVTPRGLVFWALFLLLPPLGAAMAGLEGDWLPLTQIPQTLVLIVAAFLYAEAGLSPYSPGSNSNASGVAAAIRADELLGEGTALENVDTQLVITGGGETGSQGVMSHLRSLRPRPERGGRLPRPRRRAPRPAVWVIELAAVGVGKPLVAARTAGAVTQPAAPSLLEMGQLLTGDVDAQEAPVLRSAPPGAADAAGRLGYPALMITSRPGEPAYQPPLKGRNADSATELDPDSIEAAARLAEGVVRLLDRDLGRQTSPPAR